MTDQQPLSMHPNGSIGRTRHCQRFLIPFSRSRNLIKLSSTAGAPPVWGWGCWLMFSITARFHRATNQARNNTLYYPAILKYSSRRIRIFYFCYYYYYQTVMTFNTVHNLVNQVPHLMSYLLQFLLFGI